MEQPIGDPQSASNLQQLRSGECTQLPSLQSSNVQGSPSSQLPATLQVVAQYWS
jgi:hypothetical protein